MIIHIPLIAAYIVPTLTAYFIATPETANITVMDAICVGSITNIKPVIAGVT
jgi:hypothetical protein